MRGEAGGADAIGRQDDVEEQPGVSYVARDFARLFQQLVAVGFVVEAERVPGRAQLLGARRIAWAARAGSGCWRSSPATPDGGARCARPTAPRCRSGTRCRRPSAPSTMSPSRSGRARLRVRRADLGRVVRPAVMALGKDGDRVDVRRLRVADELHRDRRPSRRRGCARRCGSRDGSGGSAAACWSRRACF